MALERVVLVGFMFFILLPDRMVGGTLGYQLLPAMAVVVGGLLWESPWPY